MAWTRHNRGVGAWGVGIFSNDAASDLREDFRDLIAQGVSAESATARLVSEYGVGGGDDEWDADFWIALGATQHRLGHLAPGVIDQAHQLPALLDPQPLRPGDSVVFLLIGEPSDPPLLRILSPGDDAQAPIDTTDSSLVVPWSRLGSVIAKERLLPGYSPQR